MEDSDIKYQQGKSKKQVEDSYKILDIAIVGIMIICISYTIYSVFKYLNA